ncbi:hypothetical protein NE619_13710 [Anaerovorax odorimutans]|uniref:Uncharacterized protein n=1 Tax=Anaerovorax odorimutans TaxID=109327 RepID=A0ABT1RRK1_9FIRM|nr:hypothetical protein [Anaerovorax odorimutans]MCQ4637786.1 hypothetical protein [Anaerovorax odorimutans]
MERKIDTTAPIIPWEGLGGIKLYSHIRQWMDYVEDEENLASVEFGTLLRYETKDKICLHFDLCNGKLYKISALKKYRGRLFRKIHTGQRIGTVLRLEPSFIYDEEKKLYKSDKGVLLEADPLTKKVVRISIYVKEMDSDEFKDGTW